MVVAIEDYVFVSDIPGAKANGLDWYSYLTDGRGIAASRVQLVTDNDATREGIFDAIDLARSAVKPVPACARDGMVSFGRLGRPEHHMGRERTA